MVAEENIFFNKSFADELKSNGVIKIPFLSGEELHLLKNFYYELHGDKTPPAMYDGIHMTIWHSDTDYKLKVRDAIKTIIEPACQRTFNNYRAISQQFIVKRKGDETTFPIHQDWAIVNEEKFFSFNMWIPLQDVTEENGAMYIVKGSHKFNRKIRGAGILFPDYRKFFDELKPFITQFEVKAGEALLFYHSTIHGSPYNQSEKPRIVVQVSILPEEVPMEIYFQKSAKSPLEIHNPEDDFNFYYSHIRKDSEVCPPTATPTKIIQGFKPDPVIKNELLTKLKTK